jgi:hypothetical protein
VSEHDTGKDAVHRSGPDSESARPFDKFARPFRLLLGFASLATAGVALWLFWVIAFALPARDPLHLPMGRLVAVCLFAYGALSWAYVHQGPRNAVLRWLVPALSAAAIGFGFYESISMIRSADAGGHFEGYIVLMGLILFGHGLGAIVHTILTQRIARRLRAA